MATNRRSVGPREHYVESLKAIGYEELERRVRESHNEFVRDAGSCFLAVPGARQDGDVEGFHEQRYDDADQHAGHERPSRDTSSRDGDQCPACGMGEHAGGDRERQQTPRH